MSKIQVSIRKERVKRSIGDLAKAVHLVEFDENSKGDIRQKRDINDEVVKVDARCNNDVLRTIIVENTDRVTAVSKRRIQAECERRLEGRDIERGVRREYGGGGSGEIGYVFGCLSYEVVLVVVGAITLISITIPVFMEENREALRLAVVGVKIIWCMFVLIGVLKKSDVCMLLCIMCNVSEDSYSRIY
ncbi:unnamed protein product [Nippostrongylus brasiliensis]|uniref:Uncharacterized protein n=1 Tax=Nippostrongylus brasiliensis TaxID=27835 RepID=A0A3P7BDI7_NIPBR|nr:unnamed protein product [Nippostrongylus brasiliensis]